MGMPISLTLVDATACPSDMESVFDGFVAVDRRFSPYKEESELCRLNRGEITLDCCGAEMHEIAALAEQTRLATDGYFDARRPDGLWDPCGIVKGWAIHNAARALCQEGLTNFCLDVGGDIQTSGKNAKGEEWRVGIRHPFSAGNIVKLLYPQGAGIATSGTYLQGAHIYNPHAPEDALQDVVSLTVIGPDILEADRFATAAFAMGRDGIGFIENLPGFEAYEIDASGMARMTSGLGRYLAC
jgi:thiamine biosynthesis lipoprotein